MMKHGVCIPSMHFAHLGGYWSWENLCQSTKPTEHKGVARIKLGEATIVQYAGAGRLDKGSAFKTWTDVLREKTSGHQGFHSQVDKNNFKKISSTILLLLLYWDCCCLLVFKKNEICMFYKIFCISQWKCLLNISYSRKVQMHCGCAKLLVMPGNWCSWSLKIGCTGENAGGWVQLKQGMHSVPTLYPAINTNNLDLSSKIYG